MIDSRQKRRAAANALFFLLLPAPDGQIDQGDREQIAGLYRGITPSVRQYIAVISDDQGYLAEVS